MEKAKKNEVGPTENENIGRVYLWNNVVLLSEMEYISVKYDSLEEVVLLFAHYFF